jgi:hypothetical protein
MPRKQTTAVASTTATPITGRDEIKRMIFPLTTRMFAPIKDKRNSVMKQVIRFSNYRWARRCEALMGLKQS